jgi:hypothetical protein
VNASIHLDGGTIENNDAGPSARFRYAGSLNITGHGSLYGHFEAIEPNATASITADGNLNLSMTTGFGVGQDDRWSWRGSLDVGAHTVTINLPGTAYLDSAWLPGGTTLTGGSLITNDHVQDVVIKDFRGHGTIVSKSIGLTGAVINGGDLVLDARSESPLSGTTTFLADLIDIGSNTLTCLTNPNSVSPEEVLAGTISLAGGSCIAENGIEFLNPYPPIPPNAVIPTITGFGVIRGRMFARNANAYSDRFPFGASSAGGSGKRCDFIIQNAG